MITMTKVAIIIPTMNRPEFLLRQFEFFDFVESPHPLYVLDSSNEENAEKIVIGIKKFKKLNIVYRWAPPGKDCLWQLMPLIKEKYCIQIGDDDLIIPKTISDCADFLEDHSDYATCAGKQVNIRFKREDYDKPYGLIEKQTFVFGKSVEDEDMLVRVKNFWSNPTFICFAVRKTELETRIRNITKNFSLTEHVMEFLLWSVLITSGKSKVLDSLEYVMQINDKRHDFGYHLTLDFMLSPTTKEKWGLGEKLLAQTIQGKDVAEEESFKIAKWIFILYLAHQFALEVDWLPVGQKKPGIVRQNLFKKSKNFVSRLPFFKSIYYKINPPEYVTRSESKYFNDFKTVRDFLEKNR